MQDEGGEGCGVNSLALQRVYTQHKRCLMKNPSLSRVMSSSFYSSLCSCSPQTQHEGASTCACSVCFCFCRCLVVSSQACGAVMANVFPPSRSPPPKPTPPTGLFPLPVTWPSPPGSSVVCGQWIHPVKRGQSQRWCWSR